QVADDRFFVIFAITQRVTVRYPQDVGRIFNLFAQQRAQGTGRTGKQQPIELTHKLSPYAKSASACLRLMIAASRSSRDSANDSRKCGDKPNALPGTPATCPCCSRYDARSVSLSRVLPAGVRIPINRFSDVKA